MSEEKQIEEMAKVICGNNRDCKTCVHNFDIRECGCIFYASRLYEQGYRKHSEGEILLPLSIEELRHLINDAIFYIRKMENCNRNKAEFGYFSRQELLEKLKNVERYYEMLNMPVCKKEDESGADDE